MSVHCKTCPDMHWRMLLSGDIQTLVVSGGVDDYQAGDYVIVVNAETEDDFLAEIQGPAVEAGTGIVILVLKDCRALDFDTPDSPIMCTSCGWWFSPNEIKQRFGDECLCCGCDKMRPNRLSF